MSNEHFVLSTLSPTLGQRLGVFGLALLMICGGLLAMPLVATPLPGFNALLLMVDAVLATVSAIVAMLLYGQFRVTRAPALSALASGFLFVALTTLPQLLRVSQHGSFNSRLLFVTDLAFPIAIIFYTSLMRRESLRRDGSANGAIRIAGAVLATFAAAILALWLTTNRDPGSARIEISGMGTGAQVMGTVLQMSVCSAALVMLWWRCRSRLDLWLLAVLTAWVLDIVLQAFSVNGASLFGLLGIVCLMLALLFTRDTKRLDADALKAITDEMNQPLFAITANADAAQRLLARDPPDLTEARAALTDIASDAQRVSRLMGAAQRLLAASPEPPAVIDVGELVQDCVVHLKSELSAHQVACDVQTTPHLPGIRGVRRQLMQMLLNLVSHSLEAMASLNARERRLTLRTSQLDARTVAISVADSGGGKPHPENLGLAICRSIVDAHGGNILMVPGAEGGTAIKIILPVSS